MNNHYFVSVSGRGKWQEWRWEIQRRPQPLGAKLYGGGFKSEFAAKLAGENLKQLAAFMSMNIERHVKAHHELYDNLTNGEIEKAAVMKAFYDEYFAVLDLTAEFYLDTVRRIFQEHTLPRGKLNGAAPRSTPMQSAAPCCLQWRASVTTSAPSARPLLPTISAANCALI